MRKVLDSISTKIMPVARAAGIFGAFVLFGMMLLMVADVGGRFLLNSPITGAYEVSAIIMVFATIFSIVYCQFRRGHISVDLITSHLPEKFRNIWDGVMHFLTLVTFGFLTYALIRYGFTEFESGGLIRNTLIPAYPFIFVMAFGCLLLCIYVLLHTIIYLTGGFKE